MFCFDFVFLTIVAINRIMIHAALSLFIIRRCLHYAGLLSIDIRQFYCLRNCGILFSLIISSFKYVLKKIEFTIQIINLHYLLSIEALAPADSGGPWDCLRVISFLSETVVRFFERGSGKLHLVGNVKQTTMSLVAEHVKSGCGKFFFNVNVGNEFIRKGKLLNQEKQKYRKNIRYLYLEFYF